MKTVATDFVPPRTRTYTFPGDNKITIEAVTQLIVSPSGTHRLKTAGKLHIVPIGWLHIEIEGDEWAV